MHPTRKNYFRITGFLFFVLTATISHGQFKAVDDYYNTALANSPVIADIETKLQQNRYDSALAGAIYKPQIAVNAQALYPPSYGDYGYDKIVTNSGHYQSVISATELISPRKEVNANRLINAYHNDSLANEANQAKNQLRKDVTDKFLTTCLLQQQMIFYMKSDSFLVDELKKVYADTTLYNMDDYYGLLVEEHSEHTQVAQYYAQVIKAFSDLNETCGIVDTTFPTLTVPDLKILARPDMNQVYAYRKFKVDSMQIAEQKILLNAQYLPHFSWYADAGILASQPQYIYKSFGNSVGLNLSMPIYDGNKRKLQSRALVASENLRDKYEKFFTRVYTSHTLLVIKQINSANLLLSQLKGEAEEARLWMKVSVTELETGNVSISDFILALKKDLEVKTDIVQTQIGKQSLINEYNFWNH
jgi:hypothetical protein